MTVLLVSISIAIILIYPFPFLYSADFSTAASSLLQHVWTDAQPLGGRDAVEPDVIMRSIWVHGSYMQALEQDVLLGALRLQDEILGPTKNFKPPRSPSERIEANARTDIKPRQRDAFHAVNGPTDESWFFHSPLQYWECSRERIEQDDHILTTVNERKTQSTSVNVTLRHSIVFSGKRFEDRQLVAADALVITLIHRPDSPVSHQWERRAALAAQSMADQWTVIPDNGRSTSTQLYEFQFRPLSWKDIILMSAAYCSSLVFLAVNLSKLSAVKSRVGIVVAGLVQILASVISSFTICAILNVNLSRIPSFLFPFAILAICMEDSFRLVRAVVRPTGEPRISEKMGAAVGETSHIAAASRAQNLMLLWGLSRITMPGVSAFCAWAAIAIVMDTFYLFTFFLGALSIDLQRIELGDALGKASWRHKHSFSATSRRQSLANALRQGRIALSTRISGIIVSVGIVLIAESHFRQHESILRTLGRFVYASDPLRHDMYSSSDASRLRQVHQARSPVSWLRLQDHDTAREIIQVVKPSADRYVARVYDPLVFVLRNANRMPNVREKLLSPAVYDFIRHQFIIYLVVALVLVALVRLFMNYLLWDVAELMAEADSDDERPLTVKTFGYGHAMDICKLTASRHGHIVSVALDRGMRVWNIATTSSYALPEPVVAAQFPILHVAVDADANWMAFLTWSHIWTWNIAAPGWGPRVPVDLRKEVPVAFFFGSRRPTDLNSVIVVRRGGSLVEVHPGHGTEEVYPICDTPLKMALPMTEKGVNVPVSSPARRHIVTISTANRIHLVTQSATGWMASEVQLAGREDEPIESAVVMSKYSAYLIGWESSVDLVDLRTSTILHTFATEPMQAGSLQVVHLSSRHAQRSLIGLRLSSVTLAYMHKDSGDCVIQTYVPYDDPGHLNFSVEAEPNNDMRMVKHCVPQPGSWEALPNGCIVGARPRPREHKDAILAEAVGQLRRRQPTARLPMPIWDENWEKEDDEDDEWEGWVFSQLDKDEGNFETVPLVSPANQALFQLEVVELGQTVQVGYNSIAVAFANCIKVIQVGHERFNDAADDTDAETIQFKPRRRKSAGHGRRVAWM